MRKTSRLLNRLANEMSSRFSERPGHKRIKQRMTGDTYLPRARAAMMAHVSLLPSPAVSWFLEPWGYSTESSFPRRLMGRELYHQVTAARGFYSAPLTALASTPTAPLTALASTPSTTSAHGKQSFFTWSTFFTWCVKGETMDFYFSHKKECKVDICYGNLENTHKRS